SAARYSPGWVRQARRGPRGSTSRPRAGLRLHPGVRPGAIRRRRWEWGQPPTLSWRAAWAADAEWMSGKSRARLAPVLTKASSGRSGRSAGGRRGEEGRLRVKEAGRRRPEPRSCGASDQLLQRGPADRLDEVTVDPGFLRLTPPPLAAVAADRRDDRLF